MHKVTSILSNPLPSDNSAKTLVNNVIFVIDESGSMRYHSAKVNTVMRSLAEPLKNAAQLTRVSVYSFDSTVRREAFMQPPSILSGFNHRVLGQTALIDATYQAVTDHQNVATSIHEDNSYLVYVITDGEENASRKRVGDLHALLSRLPDNWTVATLVPDLRGVHAAKQAGFPAGNIETWNVNSATGFEEVGRRLADTYSNYTTMRASGAVGTKSLFVNTTHLDAATIKASLVEDTTSRLFTTNGDAVIKDFVEAATGAPYQKGSTYYELTKSEKVQVYKEIAIVNKNDGKKYFGPSARAMLGLPHDEVKIRPGSFGEWRIFVQSTSLNRKLPTGTSVLVK